MPGQFDGQRSLEDYNPQGHKESDMTEATELASTLEDIHRLSTCILVSWENVTQRLCLHIHVDRKDVILAFESWSLQLFG